MRLLIFLELIIKCSANDDASFKVLHHIYPDKSKTNIPKDFMVQLKKDSKAVIKKI